MKKTNMVGYVMCALLPFPALAATEIVSADNEAVLESSEIGLEDGEASYSKPGKITGNLNLGSLSGEAKERVYADSQGGRKISQLDWQYDSAPTLKGNLEWDIVKRLSLGLSAWTTVAKTAGKMNDYDWLDADQQQWTHHSYHADTDLKHAREFDINLKAWLFNHPTWRFGLMAGYQDTHYSFVAKGGIFNYGNGAYRGEFIDAKAISYQQRFTVPYIGVAGNYRYGEFEAGGAFKFSSWVKATAIDHHYFRDLTFKDDARGQQYFSLTGNLGYELTEHSQLFFEAVASMILDKKGDTKVYDHAENTVTTFKNASGIENYSYLITVGWKYGF